MNNLTFMDSAIMMSIHGHDVEVLQPPMMGGWDRQTLVFWCSSNTIMQHVIESIRFRHKPTSTSEGNGYRIDVYTNLNYSINERNPAMRNIRAVYCNENILTLKALNERFPNSYIIKVKEQEKREESVIYDITRKSVGEIPKISSYRRCP